MLHACRVTRFHINREFFQPDKVSNSASRVTRFHINKVFFQPDKVSNSASRVTRFHINKVFFQPGRNLWPRLHYNVLGTARLALRKRCNFFSARHCMFTLIFLPCRFKNWQRTERGCCTCVIVTAHTDSFHGTARLSVYTCRNSWHGTANRDLKQARTAMVVNKQLNFTVKNKPHTTNYIYCIFYN